VEGAEEETMVEVLVGAEAEAKVPSATLHHIVGTARPMKPPTILRRPAGKLQATARRKRKIVPSRTDNAEDPGEDPRTISRAGVEEKTGEDNA